MPFGSRTSQRFASHFARFGVLMVVLVGAIIAMVDEASAADGIFWRKDSNLALFQSDEVLELQIDSFFEQIVARREFQNERFPGRLIHGRVSIPVEIHARGQSSLSICKFPKLRLHLSSQDSIRAARGTVFEGLTKLDIGTHCDAVRDAGWDLTSMKFNHREAVAYKWAHLAGLPTAGVRRARIKYTDPDSFIPDMIVSTHQAILIQNMADYATDMGMKELRGEEVSAAARSGAQLELSSFMMSLLFQRWIGNTDWEQSFPQGYLHNYKALQMLDGRVLTIPTDFNLSELARGTETPQGIWEMGARAWIEAPVEWQRAVLKRYRDNKNRMYQIAEWLRRDDPVGYRTAKSILDRGFQSLYEMEKQIEREQ